MIGITRGAVNGMLSGAHRPSAEMCAKIAKAFHLPVEQVYQVAGYLPQNAGGESDPLFQQIEVLYNTLSSQENKERALEFLQFLKTQEGKFDHTGKKPKR